MQLIVLIHNPPLGGISRFQILTHWTCSIRCRATTRCVGTEVVFRWLGVARLRWGAFCLLGLLLLRPAVLTAQNSQQDFDVFLAKFKLAVVQKDAATLMTLMMPGFNFIRAQGVSPSDVFKGLDANGGLQWTNLQQSVQGQPILYRLPHSNTPTRVLQCTPTDTIYMCLVMFQQDIHHRWRWKGMIMPTR
jgi:hypothetical protein